MSDSRRYVFNDATYDYIADGLFLYLIQNNFIREDVVSMYIDTGEADDDGLYSVPVDKLSSIPFLDEDSLESVDKALQENHVVLILLINKTLTILTKKKKEYYSGNNT